MKKLLLPFFLMLFCFNTINAADITSNGTGGGDWGVGASWSGGNVPASTDNVIIATGDVITIATAVTRNSGTTTTVNGTLINTAGLTLSGTMSVFGTYQHNNTSTTIPLANWQTNSTCYVTGIVAATGMTSANSSQAFYNFKWNCTGQTSTCNWSLNDGTTFYGDVTIQSTGSGKCRFTSMSGATPKTLNFNGNYIQSGGVLEGTGSGATGLLTINIGGNVSVATGTSSAPGLFFVAASTPVTWNIKNFTVDNGAVSKGSGIVNLNVNGDFSLLNTSNFLSGGSGAFNINFIKSGTSSFSKTVASVILNNSNIVNFTVKSGCTLDMGTSILNSASTLSTFTVETGAGLKIGDPGGISLTGATGNVQTSATSNPRVFNSGSSYEYIGSVSQVTGNGLPASINNLTINNSAVSSPQVILSQSIFITGTLKSTLGKLDLGANNITLVSTNSGTAQVASTSVTNPFIYSGVGVFTVQRYISGGRRTSRFLGHPFSAALSMSSLIDNIYITGDGTTAGTGGASPGTGFDATATNAASSYWFDNGVAQAWKAFTTTSDASWTQHKGIRVLVRGDRSQPTALTGGNPTPNAVTLDMTGTLNTGDQTITIPTGYSVFGNPYPSPLNIGTKLDATANIGTQYWLWDANAGPTAGAYVTRTIGSGAYNLAMNGAFVVQPTAGTSITFTESDKQATATANLFRTTTTSGQLELQVLYNNYHADNMFVRFNNNSNDSKDALDGEKLNNPEINFYALSLDSKKLSLDTRPFAENKIIPLGFTATAANSFKIKVADYGITEAIYLKDKYLNVTTQLLSGTEYSFSVDPAIPATLGENRFELMMKTNSALPATFLNVAAAQKNAGIEVSFTTANETNMSNYEVEESVDGVNFTKATSIAAKNAVSNTYSWFDATVINGDNFYRIKSIEKNGANKYSNVVKVKLGGKNAEFTVYPNPVKGGVVSLQMSNVEKGIYTVKIYNNIGQELAMQTIKHSGGSATQTIDLGKGIASGTYNMQITNGTTVITKTVIVE